MPLRAVSAAKGHSPKPGSTPTKQRPSRRHVAETDGHGATAPQPPGEFPQSSGPMFVDANSMKQKLKEQMIKPTYDVSQYYHKTGWSQWIAKHFVFEVVTLSVIAFNALWISIDTDLNTASTVVGAHPVFQVAENFFCLYFFLEWLTRFCAFKKKRNGCRDAWFVFDSCLVLLMVMETWVMSIVILATGGSGAGGLGNASILRMARLLRLTRMARMARLLRAMPELMILIKGMLAAMRSVIFTLFLLVAIIYIFAIAFRQLCDGTELGTEFFATVPAAMTTLLHRGAFMDEFNSLAVQVSRKSPPLLLVLYLFVLLASLTLMNMLIGVLVDVVQAVASTEKESNRMSYVKEKLMFIMKTSGLDVDEDGHISRQEFMNLLDNNVATSTFLEVDVDPVNLVENADFIFSSDEVDENEQPKDKELSFGDLIEITLELRGTNTATVKDIVNMRKYMHSELEHLAQKLTTKEIKASTVSGSSAGGSPEDLAAPGDYNLPFEKQVECEALLNPVTIGDTIASIAVDIPNTSPTNGLDTGLGEVDAQEESRVGGPGIETNKLIPAAAPSDKGLKWTPIPETSIFKWSPSAQHAKSQANCFLKWQPLRDNSAFKEILVLPAAQSNLQRRVEALSRNLLQELDEQYARALAELRAENSRLLEELSRMWHASVWHVAEDHADGPSKCDSPYKTFNNSTVSKATDIT